MNVVRYGDLRLRHRTRVDLERGDFSGEVGIGTPVVLADVALCAIQRSGFQAKHLLPLLHSVDIRNHCRAGDCGDDLVTHTNNYIRRAWRESSFVDTSLVVYAPIELS